MDDDDDAAANRVLDAAVAREIREHGALVPPWLKYPELTRYSIHWRMGSGESYMMYWWRWAEDKAWDDLVAYFRAYAPVPVAWADWVAVQLDDAGKADAPDGGAESEEFDFNDPAPWIKRLAALGLVDFEAWRLYWEADA